MSQKVNTTGQFSILQMFGAMMTNTLYYDKKLSDRTLGKFLVFKRDRNPFFHLSNNGFMG